LPAAIVIEMGSCRAVLLFQELVANQRSADQQKTNDDGWCQIEEAVNFQEQSA